MRLSKTSAEKLEEFTKIFFRNEFVNPPQMKIYAKCGAGLLTTLLNVQGVTLGRYVFLHPSLVWKNEQKQICAPKWLIAHEFAHVLQYRKFGVVKFLYSYFKIFWQKLKHMEKWDFNARLEAYLEIPYEIEARNFETEYLKWSGGQEKRQSRITAEFTVV